MIQPGLVDTVPALRRKTVFARIKRELIRNKLVYIVLTPVLLHFLLFTVIPVVASFIISFFNWSVTTTPEFVGLANWEQIFRDPVFGKSLLNTMYFTLMYVIPTMALGLGLALMVNSKVKGAGFFRVAYFLPVVTSFVVLSSIWGWIFNAQENSVANWILSWFGIPPQLLLSDPHQALAILAGLSIVKVCANVMVYYYAGLRGIPDHLYEAVKIDGANNWQQFWHITLPLLKPATFYVAVITTIGSIQVFDSAYLLTNGGPNYATTTLVYYIYQVAFSSLQMGYASAMAYILFLIILAISLIQRKLIGQEVSYF